MERRHTGRSQDTGGHTLSAATWLQSLLCRSYPPRGTEGFSLPAVPPTWRSSPPVLTSSPLVLTSSPPDLTSSPPVLIRHRATPEVLKNGHRVSLIRVA